MNTPLRDLYDNQAKFAVEILDCDPEERPIKAMENAKKVLSIIASKMPEELEVDSENHNHMTEAQYQFIVGRNEALAEVKSILKGGTDE
jgi:hypothetical protein